LAFTARSVDDAISAVRKFADTRAAQCTLFNSNLPETTSHADVRCNCCIDLGTQYT
jgi:hypothetical protein